MCYSWCFDGRIACIERIWQAFREHTCSFSTNRTRFYLMNHLIVLLSGFSVEFFAHFAAFFLVFFTIFYLISFSQLITCDNTESAVNCEYCDVFLSSTVCYVTVECHDVCVFFFYRLFLFQCWTPSTFTVEFAIQNRWVKEKHCQRANNKNNNNHHHLQCTFKWIVTFSRPLSLRECGSFV